MTSSLVERPLDDGALHPLAPAEEAPPQLRDMLEEGRELHGFRVDEVVGEWLGALIEQGNRGTAGRRRAKAKKRKRG